MKSEVSRYLKSYKSPCSLSHAQIRDFIYSASNPPWSLLHGSWKKFIRDLRQECEHFVLPSVPIALQYVEYDENNSFHKRFCNFFVCNRSFQ